jgi:hypothetical protein
MNPTGDDFTPEHGRAAKGRRPSGEVDQVADRAVGLDGVPQRLFGADAVGVLPAHLVPLDEAASLEIGDDPLHRPLGDAHPQGHLPEHGGGRLGKQDQDVGMVGEKGPPAAGRRRRTTGKVEPVDLA